LPDWRNGEWCIAALHVAHADRTCGGAPRMRDELPTLPPRPTRELFSIPARSRTDMTHIDRKRMPFAMLAAIALALITLPVPQASAKVATICKPGLFVGPWGAPTPYESASRNWAKGTWQKAVSISLGLPWSHWVLSKHQSIACKPNPSKGGGMVCQATARPCRQVTQPSASNLPPPRLGSRFVISRPGVREPIKLRRPPQFTGRPRLSAAPMMRRLAR
jgi:hypothetical protein